ncbi:MAG: YcgL domain-containing protein [Gammaproteobacteria bacterium]|nr:YcgL domain-containing protein [Gammaproteobacteria bacterium]
MLCYIYRCSRKPDMYIYLAEEDDFSKVPKDIFNSLGIIEFAMELELSPDKKLAKEDPIKVMANLKENSFHLQLPDETPVEELMTKIAQKKI